MPPAFAAEGAGAADVELGGEGAVSFRLHAEPHIESDRQAINHGRRDELDGMVLSRKVFGAAALPEGRARGWLVQPPRQA